MHKQNNQVCAHRDALDMTLVCPEHKNPRKFFGHFKSKFMDNVSHIKIAESAYNSEEGREIIKVFGRNTVASN